MRDRQQPANQGKQGSKPSGQRGRRRKQQSRKNTAVQQRGKQAEYNCVMRVPLPHKANSGTNKSNDRHQKSQSDGRGNNLSLSSAHQQEEQEGRIDHNDENNDENKNDATPPHTVFIRNPGQRENPREDKRNPNSKDDNHSKSSVCAVNPVNSDIQPHTQQDMPYVSSVDRQETRSVSSGTRRVTSSVSGYSSPSSSSSAAMIKTKLLDETASSSGMSSTTAAEWTSAEFRKDNEEEEEEQQEQEQEQDLQQPLNESGEHHSRGFIQEQIGKPGTSLTTSVDGATAAREQSAPTSHTTKAALSSFSNSSSTSSASVRLNKAQQRRALPVGVSLKDDAAYDSSNNSSSNRSAQSSSTAAALLVRRGKTQTVTALSQEELELIESLRRFRKKNAKSLPSRSSMSTRKTLKTFQQQKSTSTLSSKSGLGGSGRTTPSTKTARLVERFEDEEASSVSSLFENEGEANGGSSEIVKIWSRTKTLLNKPLKEKELQLDAELAGAIQLQEVQQYERDSLRKEREAAAAAAATAVRRSYTTYGAANSNNNDQQDDNSDDEKATARRQLRSPVAAASRPGAFAMVGVDSDDDIEADLENIEDGGLATSLVATAPNHRQSDKGRRSNVLRGSVDTTITNDGTKVPGSGDDGDIRDILAAVCTAARDGDYEDPSTDEEDEMSITYSPDNPIEASIVPHSELEPAVEANILTEQDVQNLAKPGFRRRLRWVIAMLVCAIVAIVAGVTIAVTTKKEAITTLAPSQSPTVSPTVSFDSSIQYATDLVMDRIYSKSLQQFNQTDNEFNNSTNTTMPPFELLFGNHTPQYHAMEWLTSNRLDVSDRNILQRYVLAVFYFSTSGPTWVNTFSFLSDADECQWDITSVACDDTGSITELDIGTCWYSRRFKGLGAFAFIPVVSSLTRSLTHSLIHSLVRAQQGKTA